jgi:hypothetical protein
MRLPAMIQRMIVTSLAAIAFVACSATVHRSAPPPVDPATDPTIGGAVAEALDEGSIEAQEGAATGRRIGRVAGVIAAVLGGPESETVDETVDRYRRTRDAAEAAGAVIGATKGAAAGAQRGYQLDLKFAELHQIEGLDVTRPGPGTIELRLEATPAHETLERIAAVLADVHERSLLIDISGETALEVSDSLADLGIPASRMSADAEDGTPGAVLRIRHEL